MKIFFFFLAFTSLINSKAQTDFTNDTISIINTMEICETVSIKHQSNGCFGSSKDSIEIIKTESDYLLVYGKNEYHITSKKIKLLINFEDELHQNHNGGCSTIDSYEILNENTNEFYTTNDSTCSWHGFTKLIEKLKLKKTS